MRSVHCLSEGGECIHYTVAVSVRAGSVHSSVHCLSEGGECALSQ